MYGDVLGSAFYVTENGFLTLVHRTYAIKLEIVAVGSCCLVGVIWGGTLYVANLGDSRAVIGSGHSNKIIAEQLNVEHYAGMGEVRKELRLIERALKEAARKGHMKYEELKKVEKGNRRFFHDDITVVVIFIDHEQLGKKIMVPEISVQGFADTAGPSKFSIPQEMT
ncbi:hypothetical protein Ancab_030932 [Ancistrocladus abbreviatus]